MNVIGRRRLLGILGAATAASSMSLGISRAEAAQGLVTDDGVLRIALEMFPSTLDPTAARDLFSSGVCSAMYEGLTKTDSTGRVLPGLAERWESFDGCTRWRFYLRRGVYFHTGRMFTANDVVKSFSVMLRNPAAPGLFVTGMDKVAGYSEFISGKTSSLSGIQVLDDFTVEFQLTTPTSIFPVFRFFMMDADFMKEHGENWHLKTSVGTGPYKLQNVEVNDRIVMSANKQWWHDRPLFEKIVFVVTGGGQLAIRGFIDNKVDYAMIDSDFIREVVDNGAFNRSISTCPRMQSRAIGLSAERYAPFGDRRVRLALSLMIDRDAVRERFFRGRASIHRGVVPPSLLTDEGLPALKCDPWEAKALLAAAGYPDGKGLEPFTVVTLPEYEQEFNYYVAVWSGAGIPVSIQTMPKSNYISSTRSGKFAMFHTGWTAGYPDPINFLGELYGSTSQFNLSRWKNNEFDKVVSQASGTEDRVTREGLYIEAQKLVMRDLPVIPIAVPDYIALRAYHVPVSTLSPFGGMVFR